MPAFQKKPVLAKDAPGRTKAVGPFVDPDPDFIITYIGAHHTLELNKFCVYRPSLLLHTKEFARQTDDLDETDFSAVLEVLDRLERPHIVLYNCGVDAGSSQGHKHLQLVPQPDVEEFKLFPFKEDLALRACTTVFPAASSGTDKTDEPRLSTKPPYKSWSIALSSYARAADLYRCYQSLHQQMDAKPAGSSEHAAYDVVLTREWMTLIPRSSKGHDGVNTNGAGMMGLIWVRDQDERDGWTKLGMTKLLVEMGLPRED